MSDTNPQREQGRGELRVRSLLTLRVGVAGVCVSRRTAVRNREPSRESHLTEIGDRPKKTPAGGNPAGASMRQGWDDNSAGNNGPR